MSGMTSSADIFNYVTGALAFVSAIASVLLYYRPYLPGTQMKILDELLQETKSLYQKAEADGLLPTGQLRVAMIDNLESLELNSAKLREQAYNATTLREEYVAMIQGLSRKIMQKAHQVKKFRAYILSSSEEQRRQQQLARVAGDTRQATCNGNSCDSAGNVDAGHLASDPDGGVLGTSQSAASTATQHVSANVSLQERETASCSTTWVEDPIYKWWSFPIPFSRFRWYFEYPSNKPSSAPAINSTTQDIASLPV